ncbi:TIM barrel protein [candidate division KSB1 bacterium]|nr:TIM barrel protein [candidate division KSB1 bacterium]
MTFKSKMLYSNSTNRRYHLLVGITVDKYKGLNPASIIKLTRKIGLKFIEITKSVFDDLPSVLEELGHIKTGFHLPNYGDNGYDFTCLDREDESDRLIELINKNHKSLNVQYCLSHPPECPAEEKSRDELDSILFDKLNKLETPVIIENVQGLSVQQFSEFYKKAEQALKSKLIGQCFDAPHYYVRGDDPVAILRNHNGPLQCVHLSDCRSGRDSHLPFDSGGELPIPEILEILKERNYDNFINLELLPRSASDIGAVIKSYLTILKTFNRLDYYRTKFRLLIYAPVLKRKIK